MASNGSLSRINTVTITNTSTTMAQSSRPRAGSQSHTYSSSASSRNPLIVRTHDGKTTPQAGDNSNSTEPFPSLHLEPPQSSQLLQTQTKDHYYSQPSIPLRNVGSNVSRREAPTVTTQVHQRPIGIKRLESQTLRPGVSRNDTARSTGWLLSGGRRRSTSEPQRATMLENGQDGAPLQHSFTAASNLPALMEGQVTAQQQKMEGDNIDSQNQLQAQSTNLRSRGGSQRMRRVSDAARSAVSRLSNRSDDHEQPVGEYNDDIIDILDVLDPEVSTLTTLTNVQNSLFVPDLGRWLNRRPTYELTKGPSYRAHRPTLNRGNSKPLPPPPPPGPTPLKGADIGIPSDIEEETDSARDKRLSLASVPSIASVVQEEHYAVLPHGVSLQGWSEEDKELLDDHVRHMLHSKREGFKRSMRAFGKYVRKPLGFFVTLYAVLITLFGLAWVLFLIGWIYVGEQQVYVINIIDNVLVALFAIMGDGLAPFRAVDTYHMGFVAYYHHLTAKIRKQRHLPKLQDHNELPEVHETEVDVEASIKAGDAEFSVLAPEQQKKLEHHQNKFSKSHSFYKPHETVTHYAFPHHLFVTIVILLDMHSCLQIALGSCTWGISYHTRPKALTPTILSCSITVNILAGVLIKVGDNKSRKKDVLLRMFRQELTEEAMRRVEKQKEEEEEEHRRQEKELLEDRVREESENNRFSNTTIEYSPQLPNK